MLNDALVVANMALEISPKFVVLHFTMANIYASKVQLNTGFVLASLIFRFIYAKIMPNHHNGLKINTRRAPRIHTHFRVNSVSSPCTTVFRFAFTG